MCVRVRVCTLFDLQVITSDVVFGESHVVLLKQRPLTSSLMTLFWYLNISAWFSLTRGDNQHDGLIVAGRPPSQCVSNENMGWEYFSFGPWKESRVQFIAAHRLTACTSLKVLYMQFSDREAAKPSYTHEEVVSQLSPKSFPVKEMESLWSAWWSFVLSPRQINSLMIDLDRTCMKKPFIYSWNLICPVLGSEALDKKWRNGKTQLSKRDRLFILLMPFSPSALQSLTQRIRIKMTAAD